MGLRRFRLELPSAWQDRTLYAFEAPAVDGRSTQLVLQVVPAAGQTLEEFAATHIARTRAALGNAEVVRQGPVDLGPERPAIEFAYRFWVEGAPRYGRETFVAHGGRLFAFSANFDEVTEPAHAPQVAQIIASLAAAPATV